MPAAAESFAGVGRVQRSLLLACWVLTLLATCGSGKLGLLERGSSNRDNDSWWALGPSGSFSLINGFTDAANFMLN